MFALRLPAAPMAGTLWTARLPGPPIGGVFAPRLPAAPMAGNLARSA